MTSGFPLLINLPQTAGLIYCFSLSDLTLVAELQGGAKSPNLSSVTGHFHSVMILQIQRQTQGSTEDTQGNWL